MAKLSEEQWAKLAVYYQEGHTLRECSTMFGLSIPTISKGMKQRGHKLREKLEPSRPEKYEKAPLYVTAKYALPQEMTVSPEGVVVPKRKIISLDGPVQKRYEKEREMNADRS